MKTKLLTLITIAFFSITSSAQTYYNWSDISTQTYLTPLDAVKATLTTGETNPYQTGNTATTTNKFVNNAEANSYLRITLPNDITAAQVPNTVIKVKLYFAEYDNLPSDKSFKMFLRKSTNGNLLRKFIVLSLQEADEGTWKEYTFDFSGTASDDAETFNDIYDEVQIHFNGSDDTDGSTFPYYFDGISSTISMSDPNEGQLLSGNAWYLNHGTADIMTPSTVSVGNYSASATNPNTTELNTSGTVSSFVKVDGSHSQIRFDLSEHPITDFTSTIFKIQAYLNVTTATALATTSCNIRIGLRNSSTSTQAIITSTISVGQKWVEYTADFTGITQSDSSYDQLTVLFSSADTDGDAIGFEYFIDALQGPDLETLSTEENILGDSNLKITPNPVDDVLNVNLDAKGLKIYNILGELVNSYTGNSAIDVSSLASGVYVLQATLENNNVQTVRFVKK